MHHFAYWLFTIGCLHNCYTFSSVNDNFDMSEYPQTQKFLSGLMGLLHNLLQICKYKHNFKYSSNLNIYIYIYNTHINQVVGTENICNLIR